MRRKLRKQIFISGKISGLPYCEAFMEFSYAEDFFKPYGYVFNPMRRCRHNWSWLRCMVVCLFNLIFRCNRIFQLPNWKDSRGGRIENFVAKLFRKEFIKVLVFEDASELTGIQAMQRCNLN